MMMKRNNVSWIGKQSQKHTVNRELFCFAPKIKFSSIEIPKFGGQITEFKHFYDTFQQFVNE